MWYLISLVKLSSLFTPHSSNSDIHFVQGLLGLGCQTLRLDLRGARTSHSSTSPRALTPTSEWPRDLQPGVSRSLSVRRKAISGGMVETEAISTRTQAAALWCDQAKSSHHQVDPIGRLMIAADINPSPPNLKGREGLGLNTEGEGHWALTTLDTWLPDEHLSSYRHGHVN